MVFMRLPTMKPAKPILPYGMQKLIPVHQKMLILLVMLATNIQPIKIIRKEILGGIKR